MKNLIVTFESSISLAARLASLHPMEEFSLHVLDAPAVDAASAVIESRTNLSAVPELPSEFEEGTVYVVSDVEYHMSEFLDHYMVHKLPRPVLHVLSDIWQLGVREFTVFTGALSKTVRLDHVFDSFVDKHKGARAFIFGNGPSLSETPVELLKDELTFGANRCYLGFKEWGFAFNYWCCVDRLQIEEYSGEYEQNLPDHVVKLVPFDYALFSNFQNVCFTPQSYELKYPIPFSGTPDAIHIGGTTTFALMQMAAIMGVAQIVLLGVDNRYNLTKSRSKKDLNLRARRSLRSHVEQKVADTPLGDYIRAVKSVRAAHKSAGDVKGVASVTSAGKLWTASDAQARTHFSNDYTENKKFILPDLDFSDAAFQSAHDYTRSHGIEVLNATPGTALDIFPKVDLQSIL